MLPITFPGSMVLMVEGLEVLTQLVVGSVEGG